MSTTATEAAPKDTGTNAPPPAAPSPAKADAAAGKKPVRRPTAKTAEKPAPKPTAKPVDKPVAKPVIQKAAKNAPAARAPAEAAPAVKPAKAKEKLVRDSFTMPRSDFALVQRLKDRALGFRHAAKKSELLRAGLHALMALDNDQLQAALSALPTLKAGRPRKGG